jgi:hypothetical protein
MPHHCFSKQICQSLLPADAHRPGNTRELAAMARLAFGLLGKFGLLISSVIVSTCGPSRPIIQIRSSKFPTRVSLGFLCVARLPGPISCACCAVLTALPCCPPYIMCAVAAFVVGAFAAEEAEKLGTVIGIDLGEWFCPGLAAAVLSSVIFKHLI